MRPAGRRPGRFAALRAPRLAALWLLLACCLAYRVRSQLRQRGARAAAPVHAPGSSSALARTLAARTSALAAQGVARAELRLALLRAFSPAGPQPSPADSDARRGPDAAVQAILWEVALAQPVVQCAWDPTLPLRALSEHQGPQVGPDASAPRAIRTGVLSRLLGVRGRARPCAPAGPAGSQPARRRGAAAALHPAAAAAAGRAAARRRLSVHL
jgi:hypothetical protein